MQSRTLLFIAALLVGATAHAAGRLAEVSVVDRETGASLPTYYARGSYWVAGTPGARYAIAIRNALNERLLAVIAVDGVNVVSGATAAVDQTGYVFRPYQRYDILGWRKSDAEVAAFEFTAAALSYAERTGRPANVGVIGVALFRERVARSAPPSIAESDEPSSRLDFRSRALGATSGTAGRAPADAAAPSEAPKLGTGHGAREYAQVTHTEFERARRDPDELIRIRYDSYEHLLALGIIPRAVPQRPWPNPFPGDVTPGYVPDPPS